MVLKREVVERRLEEPDATLGRLARHRAVSYEVVPPHPETLRPSPPVYEMTTDAGPAAARIIRGREAGPHGRV